MISKDSKPSKRRAGRHRLPPLAQGPALQFIVATHPDDFRATAVLRNVRSHVMYKHQETRASSPTIASRSREGSTTPRDLTRTPSPAKSEYFGVLQTTTPPVSASSASFESALSRQASDAHSTPPPVDCVRNLAERILSAANRASTSSAPPACEGASEYSFPRDDLFRYESLDELKLEWIRNTVFFCHDQAWMQFVCNNHLSFLSHVYATLVYRDIDEGLPSDSCLTVFAKTKVLRLISNRLDTENATIVCILHLIISEIGNVDEDVFGVHQHGLATCLKSQKEGLSSSVARFMTLVMLTYAISRNQPESAEFTPWCPPEPLPDNGIPISPLSPPIKQTAHIYRVCSVGTAGIILEIQTCTDLFLARWSYAGWEGRRVSSGQLANCDSQLQVIYSRLLSLPSTENDIASDWIYESCRIAALIYCQSMVHGTSLANSASTVHLTTGRPDSRSATLLSALHNALERTDTRGCWGPDLSGVFLWVALIGSSASWTLARLKLKDHPETPTWAARCFSLYAMRAAASGPFERADATIHALRKFLQVRHWVAVKAGSLAVLQ